MMGLNMEREKEDRLQQELLDGETIEWCGEPKPSAVFTTWDILMIPFSLLWCSFAIFWEVTVITAGVPLLIFPLFGSFAVIIGLYIVFGRFFVKYYNNKNAAYAITNWRILVLSKRSVSAREFTDVPFVKKTERRDGSGSLDFEPLGRKIMGWNMNSNMSLDLMGFGQRTRMKFTSIENVKEVYRLASVKIHAAKILPQKDDVTNPSNLFK